MCGIAGYVGDRNIYTVLIESLMKLEYRGYDSAGIAVIRDSDNYLKHYKTVGHVSKLKTLLQSDTLVHAHVGIAHTRWATHGIVTIENTHPHFNDDGTIAIVHNGIVENVFQLKQALEKEGCIFKTKTDSELIVHLMTRYYRVNNDLMQSILMTSEQIQGSFSLAVISYHYPGQIFAIKKNMPLIVGLNTKEYYLSSDAVAIPSNITSTVELKDLEIANLSIDGCSIFDSNGKQQSLIVKSNSHCVENFSKDGFKHFMLKEIYQQPDVIERIFKHYIHGEDIQFSFQSIPDKTWESIQYIVIVACGTSYNAGLVARYILEKLTNILVSVEMSSEFRYGSPILTKQTLAIFISQSGETADTLAAFRSIQHQKSTILSIVNTHGSSLARESKNVIYTHAGIEVAVASTKAYTAQLTILYLLAIYMSQKLNKNQSIAQSIMKDLKRVPEYYHTLLEQQKIIHHIVKKHAKTKSFLFLGRHLQYPIALEGALKLKEVSYIFAEGYAAGEMKHGHIALIDKYCTVICLVPQSMIYSKMMSNISEMYVRGGNIITVATKGDKEVLRYTKDSIEIPFKVHDYITPFLTVILLQLLAYEVGLERGCNIDRPRNLAKSVTVE